MNGVAPGGDVRQGAGSGAQQGWRLACPSYPTFPGWEPPCAHLHWNLSLSLASFLFKPV